MKVVVMSVSDCIHAVSDQNEDNNITRNSLFAVFVPGGSGKAGPGGAIVTPMLTALKTEAFRDEVRQRVKWERAGKDQDEMVNIMDKVKEKYFLYEAVEAANMAAAGRSNYRRDNKPPPKKGDGQQASLPATANARSAFKAPVDKC